MTTLYITHEAFLDHSGPPGHPERPDRLRAVERAVVDEPRLKLQRLSAPIAEFESITRVHRRDYVESLRKAEPEAGIAAIDADTYLSRGSLEAARRAAGAGITAVDKVIAGEADNAFCAVRPPGHHAESARGMGFCLFNSIAVAAAHAREIHKLERVAIVDFDVHHGNGTQEIFWRDKAVLYASTHQMPLYPGTGSVSETGVGNIFNAPLRPGDGGEAFRAVMNRSILPAVERFRPELVLVSAGFDAHVRDPLAQLQLTEADFAWITEKLMAIADAHASGRLVSMLEGGYDLTGLARSVVAHLEVLQGG
jgi:acetoin utilization deacetylase AcuC-like enzyme